MNDRMCQKLLFHMPVQRLQPGPAALDHPVCHGSTAQKNSFPCPDLLLSCKSSPSTYYCVMMYATREIVQHLCLAAFLFPLMCLNKNSVRLGFFGLVVLRRFCFIKSLPVRPGSWTQAVENHICGTTARQTPGVAPQTGDSVHSNSIQLLFLAVEEIKCMVSGCI